MLKAKRVLLLVTQADWGGVQMFLIRFAQALMQEGHEVLLAAGGEGELWAAARAAGIPNRRLRYMLRDLSLLNDPLAIYELKRLLEEFKPDAIHLNSSKMGVLGSLAARLARPTPWIVYRIGGWSFLEPLPRWKQWIYRTAERLTAGLKDIILTVHPGDAELAQQLGFKPRSALTVVPNGLDVPEFISRLQTRQVARQLLGVPVHAFVYGTIANAYPTKALLPYLDVLAKLCAEDRGVYAVIIGDGPEYKTLIRKRDQLGLHDRILLPGQRQDAATLYPAFDVFILPSRKEGMPWTILEAMTAGLPVIATDVGACRWMLQDTTEHRNGGIIVPAQNPLLLVEALRHIKNDQNLRQLLSAAGRSIVQNRFTWQATYQGNRQALLF